LYIRTQTASSRKDGTHTKEEKMIQKIIERTQKISKKTIRAGIAFLIALSIFLPSIPFQEVQAAAAVTQLAAIDLPVFLGAGTGIDDWMRVYVMQDSQSGSAVYCTRKGSSLPSSSFALDQADLNNNPLLFYRLNSIYTNGRSWITGTFTRTTPHAAGIDYAAAQQYFGFITNQIAIWMVLGEMGYQSGNLVGGMYGVYDIYDAYVNGTIQTMNNASYNTNWTASLSIPDSVVRTARQSYLNDVHNAYTILSTARIIADAALALVGSYTLPDIVCTASLTNQSGWSYNWGTGLYEATIDAYVDNGGTWEVNGANNCTPNITSGVNGTRITISADYGQMHAGSAISIYAIPPDPSATGYSRVLCLFTSNGQSFVDMDFSTPRASGNSAAIGWNPLVPPSITLTKTDRDTGAGVGGAHFYVWTDPGLTVGYAEGDTDASGNLVLANVPDGTFYWRETAPPAGYSLDSTLRSFTVAGGVVVGGSLNVTNVQLPEVPLTKIGSDTGAGVAGATFTVYTDAACTVVFTSGVTNGSGTFTLNDVPDGDYYWKETASPANYNLNSTIHAFTVTSGVVSGTLSEVDIHYPNVTLTKSDSATSVGVAGATFNVYSNPALTILFGTGTTGAAGTFTLSNVPDGVYYWVEQTAPAGYNLDPTVYSFSVIGGVVSGTLGMTDTKMPNINLLKTGSDTGLGVPGATFTVYTDAACTVVYASGVTNASGIVFLTNVPDGNYWWKETASPATYNLNPAVFSFSVVAGTVSGTTTLTDIRKPNIDLTKTDGTSGIPGTEFTVYTDAAMLNIFDSGVTGANGIMSLTHVPDGTYYWRESQAAPGFIPDSAVRSFTVTLGEVTGTVSMIDVPTSVVLWKTDAASSAPLSGAHFVVRDSANAIVGEGDTDLTGSVTFARLPIGTYTFTETVAPENFLINTVVMTFTIHSDGTISGDTIMSDVRQPIQLMLTKEKEQGTWNAATQVFDFPIVPAEGVVFSVYANEDIEDPMGNVVFAKDALVTTTVTGADGIARTTTDLYFGDYYAMETGATQDLILSTTRYDLSLVQQDQTSSTAVFKINNGDPIINREIAGTMEIYKLAADTQLPMTGVVFEVYDKDGTLVDTVTTGSDGHAKTKVLPYGAYTLIETKTITGYALADKQTFTIYLTPHDGETISEAQMTVEDQKMAQVEVFKVTADDTQTPMNGVVFGVFDAKTDLLIATITTDKDGYGSARVAAGSYYLLEVKTWDGYLLSAEKMEISAEWAHVYTYHLTNTLTELTVNKTSMSGDKLEGMQFAVSEKSTGRILALAYDAQQDAYLANEVLGVSREDPSEAAATAITGEDGTAKILGLKAGEYEITEVVAPTGYAIAETPSSVRIDERESKVLGVSITIKDSQITTKTGETDQPFILTLAATGCLLLAISILVMIGRKRNR